MKCNVCQNNKFEDRNSRKKICCTKCKSLERTRLMALFIEQFKLINETSRILHLAPEKGLANYFRKIAENNCTFADLCPENYSFIPNVKKIDLCNDLEKIESESFDLIVHSHVMEHLPCNYTYILYHLNRIMTKNGRMICSIPFLSGFYDSCTSPDLSDEDRVKRFGQNDHIRKFGQSDLDMSIGKVYKLEKEYNITRTFSKKDLEKYNIPKNTWRGYTPSSVLMLKKTDYLLQEASK